MQHQNLQKKSTKRYLPFVIKLLVTGYIISILIVMCLNVSNLLVLMAVGLPLMLTRNSYHVLLTILILCPLFLECTP